MVGEKKEYNIRVELKLEGNYSQEVKNILRPNELYGGEPVLVSIKLINVGSLLFTGIARNIMLTEMIGSSGEQWTFNDVKISNLNVEAEVTIVNTYIVPLGEGLLTIKFDLESNDGNSVKIEGRNGRSFMDFVYVHNRLLIQLILKR